MSKKRTMIWTIAGALTLVILLLAVTGVWAEPSQTNGAAPSAPMAVFSDTISFQGRLLDSDGNPVNGSPMMTFRVYTQAEGGDPVWEDAFNVPVENGLFNAALEVPPSLFDGQALWLGVHVEGDAQEMQPRQQLLPTPYALYAKGAPWSGLTNVPPGLNDGDDDTLYWAGPGLELVGTTFEISTTYSLPQTCGDGDIAEWNAAGGTWDCGSDDVGSGAAAWLLSGNAGTVPGTDVLGTTDVVSLTLVVGAAPALRLEPGTVPNLIGGDEANSVTNGVRGATIGGGGSTSTPNQVTDDYGTVGGGAGNRAGNNNGSVSDAYYATVGGGDANTASGGNATVGGGTRNTASGPWATVSGGNTNTASSSNATIGGGADNTASGNETTVGGGNGNIANSRGSTVGGGDSNTASGDRATVGGGVLNTASGDNATVGGGHYNLVEGDYATIAGGGPSDPVSNPTTTNNRVYDDYGTIGGGGRNRVGSDDGDSTNATYATIGGGYQNVVTATYATVSGGHWNTASGNEATVGGGQLSTASGNSATVAGGYNNIASGDSATVSGGSFSTASGDYATVSGGSSSIASGNRSFVGSGFQNIVTATDSTIAGGFQNVVTNTYATIGGGRWNRGWGMLATVGGGSSNVASGVAATIPGGYINSAQGDYSFAAGRRAKAAHTGAFVWADSNDFDFSSSAADQFSARATGGARFVLGIDGSGNPTWTCSISSGGGAWACSSDRNLKENLARADGQDILERLSSVPIYYWNPKGHSVWHVGPMAQDFYAAFEVGESDVVIDTIDLDGVALAAIQGLYTKNQALEAENAALQTQIDDLEIRLAALEQTQTSHLAPTLTTWWPLAGLVVLAGIVVTRRRHQKIER